jgi:penicillin-binding protein 1A
MRAGRPGGAPRELALAFVRDTKEYKAARAAGQADDQAIKALTADADFMQTLKDEKTRLQAGFMALDPTNGQVMAWVGSRDFADDQFDHVQQARRQPGSTFKPFVYGAAFEDGARPSEALSTARWKSRWATAPSGGPPTAAGPAASS